MSPKLSWAAKSYDVVAKFNGQPASGLGIKLATGANALDTANAIRAEPGEDGAVFPVGDEDRLPAYDTTPVRENFYSRSG